MIFRALLAVCFLPGLCLGGVEEFVEAAAKEGPLAKRAAEFLVEGMPERDREELSVEFLMENLRLALKAREEFSWAKAVPEGVFFNDVVPYASLDETRERWRPEFYETCSKLVKDCESTTEAAQVINREFFKIIGVHYNTGRKAPNQSPAESKKLGMATCTGLSIILVDACRSVGVPARVAGTALWANKRGNHTWVEIYDGGQWFFTGADEYDAKGLNRGWFAGDASKAVADDWRHAIWATSWRKTGDHFPMVWSLKDRSVPAVNVTSRYVKEEKAAEATAYFRLWDKRGGERLVGELKVRDETGKVLGTVTTKAGTADLNDMASVPVRAGGSYRVEVTVGDEVREETFSVAKESATLDLYWEGLGRTAGILEEVKGWLALLPEERHLSVPEGGMSEEEAGEVTRLIEESLRGEILEERKQDMKRRVVRAAGKEMKYLERVFGDAPEGERSLWISMHGGGGAPARVNDQQWQNQIRLYEPKEGIVVAPRAPTNTWNLWHEGHIDALFDRLIEDMVALRGVNPNKVYLMGYSAGGDGVYQLAPRMADRFAAASMMAGHPNDASPLGLRNLPFMIFMGGEDAAYKRNEIAAEWGEKLAKFREDDAEGYEHKVTIYKGLGHWMKGKDREALPWMAERVREPWPKKVVWHQSGRTHDRFYWLAVPEGTGMRGQTVRAEVKGQVIGIESEGVDTLRLRLSDALVDLDDEVVVRVNGEEKFKGKVEREVRAIWESLNERFDGVTVASAILTIDLK
ncbi:MAG: transglutaminase domain-containing protein [Verrucomicrobiaceae bacterium]